MTFLFAKVKKKTFNSESTIFQSSDIWCYYREYVKRLPPIYILHCFVKQARNSLKVYSCNLPQFKKKISAIKRFVGRDWQFMAKCQAGTSSFRKCSKLLKPWLLTNKDCVYLCAIRAKSCAIDFQTKSVLTQNEKLKVNWKFHFWSES